MKFKIRVTPRAKKNAVKYKDGLLRVYVTAPPVDGKANEAVVDLLAESFDLRRSDIIVVSGHTTHDKVIEVANTSPSLRQLLHEQQPLL